MCLRHTAFSDSSSAYKIAPRFGSHGLGWDEAGPAPPGTSTKKSLCFVDFILVGRWKKPSHSVMVGTLAFSVWIFVWTPKLICVHNRKRHYSTRCYYSSAWPHHFFLDSLTWGWNFSRYVLGAGPLWGGGRCPEAKLKVKVPVGDRGGLCSNLCKENAFQPLKKFGPLCISDLPLLK